jgi:hypothetical protein
MHVIPAALDAAIPHCLASCLITQDCGYETAVLAEGVKENYDYMMCKLTGADGWCDSAYQPTDYLDNMIGRTLAQRCGGNCYEGCASLKAAPPGEPGPYSRGRR